MPPSLSVRSKKFPRAAIALGILVVIFGAIGIAYSYEDGSGVLHRLLGSNGGRPAATTPCNQAATTTPCPRFTADLSLDDPGVRLIVPDGGTKISAPIVSSWVFIEKNGEIRAEHTYGSELSDTKVSSPKLVEGGVVYTDETDTTRKMFLTDIAPVSGIRDPRTLRFVSKSEWYLADSKAVYLLSSRSGIAWDPATFSVTEVPTADPTTFHVIADDLLIAGDAKQIYVDGKPQPDIDPPTFSRVEGTAFRDKDTVYIFKTTLASSLPYSRGPIAIERHDPEEFLTAKLPTVAGVGYYRDGDAVYYQDYSEKPVRIPGAEPDTFLLLSGYLGFSARMENGGGIREGLPFFYARDAKRVYYKGAPLPQADPKTFTLIENGAYYHSYGTDGTRVYFGTTTIPGADPKSFKPLWRTRYEGCGQSSYAVDADVVYFQAQIVPGADPATFEVLINGEDASGVSGSFGRDKRGIYRGTEFVPNLPKTFEPVCNYG